MPPIDVATARAGSGSVNDDVLAYYNQNTIKADKNFIRNNCRRARVYVAMCHRWEFSTLRKIFTITSQIQTDGFFSVDQNFAGELVIIQQGKKRPPLEYRSPNKFEWYLESDNIMTDDQYFYTIYNAVDVWLYPPPKTGSIFKVVMYKDLLDEETPLPPRFDPAIYAKALALCGAPTPPGGIPWAVEAKDCIEKLIRIDSFPNQERVDIRAPDDILVPFEAL